MAITMWTEQQLFHWYTSFTSLHLVIGLLYSDRYDEGYGISYKGIDYAADNDVKLIIYSTAASKP